MSLQTEVAVEKEKTAPENSELSHLDDNQSNTSSEDVALSPKRQNQKRTPPAQHHSRKSTRNRQSALSNAFGNAIPLNTINEQESNEVQKPKELGFEIDSPPDQQKLDYPSLKSLIQEMSFTDKTPQYQACLKFLEAISPKHGNKQTEVVDLTSPTAEDIAENNNDILLVKDINKQTKNEDTEMQDVEEHNKQEEELSKDGNNRETFKVPRGLKTQKLQYSNVEPRTQFILIISILKFCQGGMSSGMDRLYIFIHVIYVDV